MISKWLTLVALLATTFLPSAFGQRVPSFGPNGTHWPELISTPFFLDENVPHKIVVNASWSEISSALNNVTDQQAAEGCLIQVRPGVLDGNGTGGGATPVIKDRGSLNWAQRVTVAPLEGYGTVEVNSGVRILRVFRTCFAGFKFSSVKFQGCKHSAVAWSRVPGWFAIYGDSAVVTDLFEAVEVVQPNHYVNNGDSANYYAAGGDIVNWRFDGCYHAPRFFEFPYSGAKPHTDTIQFSAVGGGATESMYFRDCAVFASNNCSIQTGGVTDMTFENCYIVAGAASLSRYPHLEGGATEATTNAFNGSGGDFVAIDSVFLGGMAINQAFRTNPWLNVTNTKVNVDYQNFLNPQNGSWSLDTDLNANNSGMPPYPTDEYLAQVWQGTNVSPTTPIPSITPPGGEYNSAQQVTLTANSTDTTIYYTLNGSTPTEDSTEYVGPITLSTGATVKAIAIEVDKLPSASIQASYSFSNITATPTFSPVGPELYFGQNVTLSVNNPDATIHYTLDGTEPNALSPSYTSPIEITGTVTVKAIAIAPNLQNSGVITQEFTQTNQIISGEEWTNYEFDANSSIFAAMWTANVTTSNADIVSGFSLHSADSFSDLACIVRFAPNGTIDARNAGVYSATETLNYTPNTDYQFFLVADLTSKTYTVYAKEVSGGSLIQIANDFAFRSEQSNLESIGNLATFAVEGSQTISNFLPNLSHIPSPPLNVRQK